MLKQEYDIRYAKAQFKFMNDAWNDSVKMAFTMEEQCRCHNLQLLWMFAIENYDPIPGASNYVTDAQIHSLFCRMGSDGIPDAAIKPPVTPTPPVPIPTFKVDWAWMGADPYAALLIADDIVYNGSSDFALGSPIYADFRDSPPNYYHVLRYPVSETIKTSWSNDEYNYGLLPDSNFRAVFTAHGYQYIVSYVALTLNNDELTKFF
jgi:hypothetical protein